MKIPKRQHWVPRFYLRYFAVPGSKRGAERVWVFHRKRDEEPYLTNITNIAAENHLYSPRRDDGTRDAEIESKLAGLEAALAGLWPRLASDFVDLSATSVRRAISLYLSIQSLRHPERRNAISAQRRRILDLIRDQPLDELGRPTAHEFQVGDSSFTLQPDELSDMAQAGPEADVQVWLDFLRENAMAFAEMLMSKRWSIVYMDEPLLITSDYPFYVASQQHEHYQIGGTDAVIMFPISPTRLLCFDDQAAPANKYYNLPNEASDMYNMLTWVNTDGFMISPRNAFDVLEGIVNLKDDTESSQ